MRLHIEYPDNWLVYGQGDAFTIAPRGGLINDSNGNKSLAYGVIINIYEPESVRQDHRQLPSEGNRAPSRLSLEEATDRMAPISSPAVRREGVCGLSEQGEDTAELMSLCGDGKNDWKSSNCESKEKRSRQVHLQLDRTSGSRVAKKLCDLPCGGEENESHLRTIVRGRDPES